MEIELVNEYTSWLKERSNGNGMSRANFTMGETHNNIIRDLNNGRLSFEEVVTMFAGILAKRYCQDRADVRVALGIFADKLFEIVTEDERDEDVEVVDSIDVGGW